MLNKMNLDFEKLPDSSRIWIYQADRELTSDEISQINNKLTEFIKSWNSHGNELIAAYKIEYNRFVFIGVNENIAEASGCSIDKSVNLIKELAKELSIDFFNRLIVYYFLKNSIEKATVSEFKNKLKNNELSLNIEFFDNTIMYKSAIKSSWIINIENSWIGKRKII